MILFSQQIEILHNIYEKFDKKPSWQSIERAPLFLKGDKFSTKTVVDFKIIALYIHLTYSPRSFIDMLEILNKMNKADIDEAMKFKSVIESRLWQTVQDIKTIQGSDTMPFNLLQQKKISVFGFYSFYKDKENLITGRLAKKRYDKIKIFVSFF